MYNIATLNKISPVGLANLSEKYQVSDDLSTATGILVRSQDMHEMDFADSLLAIARAGAGVNNIPLDKCADQGIVVFNTPGANANAVKELVIAGMFLSARNIPQALIWASGLTEDISKQVEKGKKQFAGTEIAGKTLAVYGLGAIGGKVANAACALGMNVLGYDAFLTPAAAHALNPDINIVKDPKEMLGVADYVSLHIPANDQTKGSVNASFFAMMKDGAVLLNYARDKLINDDDLLAALESGKLGRYVTDFVTDKIAGAKGVIFTPHLGASTEEAEDNCATIAVDEIMDFVEKGNIRNSVNFPAASLPLTEGETRIAVTTKGIAAPVDAVVKGLGVTVNGVAGGARGDYGYVLVSTMDDVTSIPEIEGVTRVRVIK
ncbi:MAG: 3-phosphoglycerate dehydrogenase [Eubacterium sp.]|nr:3-phosphoglycerate dehydrogenase [Eubacterium sp.]